MRFLLLSLCLSSLPALAQEQVLQISGANFRPLPLAVVQPAAEPSAAAAAKEFDDALMFDLKAAGVFQVLERKGFLASADEGLDAKTIQFPRWTDVGAEALVKSAARVSGDTLNVDVRVYNVGSARQEQVFTASGHVNAPRRVAHEIADAIYKHFTREPGAFASGKITYVRQNGRNRTVWISDWDGSHPQVVASSGLDILPALSRTGAVAYTSYRDGTPSLWIQTPGGSAQQIAPSSRTTTGVAFSPDGRKIAFSRAQGEGTQLFVANVDGSDVVQLTDTPAFINSSPAWSPDGKRIAFVSNRFGNPQVFVMNADGSGVQRLTYQGKYNQTPAWSPRGDFVAFTARDERNVFDVFLVDVKTRKVTRLTQGQGNNEEPTFSPNGRLVMFTSTRDGGTRLYVSTLNGEHQLPLPMKPGTYLTPAWARVDAP